MPMSKTLKIDQSQSSSDLPCHLFFLNKELRLQQFQTFGELSDYLVTAALDKTITSTELQNICNRLLQIPLRTVNHYSNLGEYLRHLYENDKMMDVLVDVKGVRFSAHRIALCCYSDFFAELFLGKNITKVPFEVRVNGISAKAFATFLEYCYTGEITVTPEIATELLIVVDYLKVGSIKSRLGKVYECVPLPQALKLLVLSNNRKGDLFVAMLGRVQSQFSEACKMDKFLKLDAKVLDMILASDNVVVESEYEVFTVVVRWLLHDIDDRVKHTGQLVNFIRFENMTVEELMRCVETTSLMRGHALFRERILVACWLYTCSLLKRDDPLKFLRPAPRKYTNLQTVQQTSQQTNKQEKPDLHPAALTIAEVNGDTIMMPTPLMTSTPREEHTCVPDKLSPVCTPTSRSPPQSPSPSTVDILVVGGFSGEEPSSQSQPDDSKFVERYDTADNQWVHFCKVPAPRNHHAVVTIGQNLYLIGGNESPAAGKHTTPTNTVLRMNVDSKEWTSIANMNEARYRHCACAWDHKIFVIGGKGNEESILRSVECYDEETEDWFYLATMSLPRFGAMATCLDDKIYIAGGIGESQEIPSTLHVLKNVVCFHLSTKSWSTMMDLRIPRSMGQLVSVRSRLFVCGGATRSYNFKNSVLNSVSSIDEFDFDKNEWEQVTDMQIPRHDFGVAVAGQKIYVIGGISSSGDQDLRSVECYDTVTGIWVPDIQELPNPAKSICCTVVKPRTYKQHKQV